VGDGFCVVCNWHGTERDLFACIWFLVIALEFISAGFVAT
jgi:hypothetical protein